MHMPRVLIVDDDPDIRGLLRDYLAADGFTMAEAGDGPGALAACRNQTPDLILLDVMLPGFDGLEVCRRIRQFSSVPIIFLTGRTDEVDQLLGFGFGADDYVCKPFSPRTLMARVKALLRRAGGAGEKDRPGTGRVKFGEFEVDLDGFAVQRDGAPVELTVKEFQLLKYFLAHPGVVLTKRQLVTGAWGEEFLGDDAALMVHLSHLRQKLGDESLIRTVRGVGYKFVPPEGPTLQ